MPLIGREPWPMTADYDRAILVHRIDMLLDREAAVALIEMVDEGDTLLIENLAVDPARQGQGLGEALLRHAETVAAEGGRRTLRLYTNVLFAANLRFYARRGFAVVREEPIADGTVVHIEKAIAPDPGSAAAR